MHERYLPIRQQRAIKDYVAIERVSVTLPFGEYETINVFSLDTVAGRSMVSWL
jgi:hypothetical protein